MKTLVRAVTAATALIAVSLPVGAADTPLSPSPEPCVTGCSGTGSAKAPASPKNTVDAAADIAAGTLAAGPFGGSGVVKPRQGGPVSGKCPTNPVDICAQLGVTEEAWVQLTPRTGDDSVLCCCNFDCVACDPSNLSDDPDFPPCVPPGDTISVTPDASVFWRNSGSCSSKTVKIGGQWVCLTPKN